MTVDLLTIGLMYFITINIRNIWVKIDNNSAEKFFFEKNVVLFCCSKTKQTCFFKKEHLF